MLYLKSDKQQTYTPLPVMDGFTLIEVLVSVVVFSVGLLGLARLQMMGLVLSSDSYLRTTAALHANDMIDRMRANVAATQDGLTSAYNNPGKTFTNNPACLGMSSNGGVDPNAQCTPAQMAAHDFAEWYASLSGSPAVSWRPAIPAQLPNGTGVVCIDSTPNDGTMNNPACDNVIAVPGKPVFAIKIWWNERKDANNPGAERRYVASFSL